LGIHLFCTFLQSSKALQEVAIVVCNTRDDQHEVCQCFSAIASSIFVKAVSHNSKVRHISLDGVNVYQTIPDLFSHATTLVKLELQCCYCHIPGFDDFSSNADLTEEEAEAYDLELQRITQTIATHSSLRHLALISLFDEDGDIMTCILEGFESSNTIFEEISCYSKTTNPEEFCDTLAPSIRQVSTLQQINFCEFDFDKDMMETIAQAMASPTQKSNIRSLCFTECNFQDMETFGIFSQVVILASISTLTLQCLDFDFSIEENGGADVLVSNLLRMIRLNMNNKNKF
jgi:hypothetical protein